MNFETLCMLHYSVEWQGPAPTLADHAAVPRCHNQPYRCAMPRSLCYDQDYFLDWSPKCTAGARRLKRELFVIFRMIRPDAELFDAAKFL